MNLGQNAKAMSRACRNFKMQKRRAEPAEASKMLDQINSHFILTFKTILTLFFTACINVFDFDLLPFDFFFSGFSRLGFI